MEISIVIPTRNRSKKLKKLLHSILEQTILPKEVIVVDDSENLRTKELIQRLEKLFLEKNIQIKHIMPLENKKKSISRARNIGAKKAKGDIIVFIDDDVIIDKNYLKEILKVFEKNPDALGVQGTIINMEYSPFWNSVKKVFYYWHAERNKCRMLPSGKTTYAYAPDIGSFNASGASQLTLHTERKSLRSLASMKNYLDIRWEKTKNFPTESTKNIHIACFKHPMPKFTILTLTLKTQKNS